MKIQISAAGAALVSVISSYSSPAAVVLLNSNTSLTGNASGTSIVENFNAYGDGTVNFTAPGMTFTGPGNVESLTTVNYARPAGDQTPYFSTTGTETISFSKIQNKFGLFWGSMDTYNSLTFLLKNQRVGVFTGSQVVALTPPGANGDQYSMNTNRYVNFSGIYDEVQIYSEQPAFEIDNISTGVPENSTWEMMLLGFGGLGFAAHQRAVRKSLDATRARSRVWQI